MRLQSLPAIIAALILFGLGRSALAAENVDVGALEYESACAVCHGRTGQGDGPLKEWLKVPMPDLTVLATNNGGVFPFDRVYRVIDGREEVATHGPRQMPIWGARYNLESSVYLENYPPHDRESSVRGRVLALVEYLYRLQRE